MKSIESIKTLEYISLKQLAQELGIDRSSLRKYIAKEGFQYEKRRMPDSGNQLAIAITREEAEAIKMRREINGFEPSKTMVRSQDGVGFFYIIQIIPDLDSNRIKLGFARNVGQRLQAHRVIAPTAKLVKKWPCKDIWERTAIDSITRIGCKLIAGEVYECDDLDSLMNRGNEFFEVLPKC